MSLQLIIDIGLFLIYCALFTLLLAWTWKFWMLYINTDYQKKLDWVFLEIKLPREINKSPEATELFLRSLIEGGGLGNWRKENWLGAMPNTASLEIASLEGVIHFYIRAEKKFKPRVEAAIYSQYPTVEIVETKEDYMNNVPIKIDHNDKKMPAFWGTTWNLVKKTEDLEVGDEKENKIDKYTYTADMYPIKTYKDWGLDKDPKEIFKHDPLTYLIEQMGAIGKGEYFFHQIIIRDANKWNDIYSIDINGGKKKGGKTEGKKTIKDLVKIEIDRFKKKPILKKKGANEKDEWGNSKKDKDGNELEYSMDIVTNKSIPVQEREDDAKKNIELIQRKISKPQVICIMRTIYMADSYDNFGSRIPMVMGLVRPFNEDGFNTFVPGYVADPFDYPWQDPFKRYVPWRKENLYGGYKGRSGLFSLVKGMSEEKEKLFDNIFYPFASYKKSFAMNLYNILIHPFKPTMNKGGFILNVEELATLYHFPGEVAATPTLPRVDSVKSSSPANLPV